MTVSPKGSVELPLCCFGMTYKMIGRELFISENTVSLMSRTSTPNSASAAAKS